MFDLLKAFLIVFVTCYLLFVFIRWSIRSARRLAARERIAELQRRKAGLEEDINIMQEWPESVRTSLRRQVEFVERQIELHQRSLK